MSRTYFTLALVLFLSASTVNSLAQNQFQSVKQIAAGIGYSITPLPGDYDGDGDIDILGTGTYVQNATSHNATILLRNDGGEFVEVNTQLPWFYSGGMYQWADLDNDNDLDIIAGGCESYCYNSKVLSIYRNDGGDTFTLITHPTNLTGGQLFSLKDYNNDGLIDIEIETLSDYDGSVIGHTFYMNTGNFVFQQTFELPYTAGEVAWGDLDNDGWVDFMLQDLAYQNLQDGTFQAFNSPSTIPYSTRYFLFDVDSDGDLDAISSLGGALLENDGNGQLSIVSIIIPYDYINSLLIADFDGDGHIDMVASGGNSSGAMTQLFHSNGDGSFTPEDVNEQYGYSYSLAVADMDNDKDPDILLSGVYAIDIILLANGLTTELSKPEVPDNLQFSVNAGTITFSWDAATDQEQSMLEYNMYLTYNDDFRIVPNADTTTGISFLPGAANASIALHKEVSTSYIPEGYYRWSVQSVDSELNTSKFATPQEFTFYTNNPANAPTNLKSTAIADHSVSLTWMDNSSDETAFTIERSSLNGNSGFEPIFQVASDIMNYTDNTVSSRSVYYYRIRLDGSSDVAYSNVTRIETPSAIAISPVNVTAATLNSASAKIDWEYAGTGITGFVIERSLADKKHFAAVGSISADKRTFTDQQLESGKTYYYRLFAVNGEDASDYSNIVNVTPPLKEFNKITLPSLAYESKYVMGAIAWGDYDNDGYDDLFLGYEAQLFHNMGDGTFEKVTDTGILASAAYNFVATWGDYDNDGFLDIYYYNDQDKSSLYRGHGDGTFTKVITVISGDRSEITNATWTDFDMDGDLDLSMTGGRYIYRYDGNDTFVRVDFPQEIQGGYYNTSVASWADYDDDGDPDVFLGNHGKDEFFRNNGDGSFTAITDQRVTVDYNFNCCPIPTPTALWTDFNNDLKLDLTVFHAGEPIYGYVNNANSLDSAFYSFEYYRVPWKNLFWTDYDSDGDLDLFVMGQYNIKTEIWENREGKPLRQLKGGPLFDYVESDAGFSWNDFDNDGYSDLFQFDEDHQVYKNISNGNSWIKIRLRGRTSNSTGLGAKVFVKSNSRWQRSDVTTHHSYQVQQGFMSLFGLGNAMQVDSVKIIWPSGNRQYLKNVGVNQVILIDENDAQEKVSQAPSNLTAQVEFPSSIILNWIDRSDDETGFVIEMMTEDGQFEEVGTVGINSNTFKVNGLSVGVKYKFRVRASTPINIRWTNTVEAQIRLFTEAFGGDLTTFRSKPEGMAWGDPDGDGDPDLFVGSHSFEPDAIYYNNGGIFTRSYLRNAPNYSRQAQWIDYNNDGYQDLHISVGGGIGASPEALNDFLYKNNGAGQLIEQSGHILAKDGYPDYYAVWGDLNKDGYLDMITPRSSDKTTVYLNLGGNIVPQLESLGLSLQGQLLLFDLDNDQDLDVLTASSFGQPTIFENVNGQFTALTDLGIPNTLYSFILEDFNNDGIQDLLIIGQNQTLKLLLFDPVLKKFQEKTNAFASIGPISKLSAGDFDNNGFLDVFVTGQPSYNSNNNRIFLNSENLEFTSIHDPILDNFLYGTVIADVNKDGHLDMVTLANDNYYDTKRYLLQGTKNQNHWLRIKLKGIGVNKFGVGARVRLFSGNTSQVRDIRSGSSSTFSDEQIAHFGLGNNTSIEYIKVEWPSGENQWIANPPIDTEMIIEQANAPGPPPPANPSNFTAAFRFPGYIDINWTDNSDKEHSFRIERAIGTNSFKPIKYLPANTISFTDSTFLNYFGKRTDIKYRVVAISYFSIESGPSNIASVEISAFQPINPSKLVATFRVPGYIDLQWTDNSDNENLFRIERAIGTNSFEYFRNLPANTTSYTDSTFLNYAENHLNVKYRVVAISFYSIESSPSNEAILSVVTGIEDDLNRMIIYPQPASSKVIIRSESALQSIKIIGGRGEILTEISATGSKEVEIPLKHFPSGIYFMQITDEIGMYVKKIIVTSDN